MKELLSESRGSWELLPKEGEMVESELPERMLGGCCTSRRSCELPVPLVVSVKRLRGRVGRWGDQRTTGHGLEP